METLQTREVDLENKTKERGVLEKAKRMDLVKMGSRKGTKNGLTEEGFKPRVDLWNEVYLRKERSGFHDGGETSEMRDIG